MPYRLEYSKNRYLVDIKSDYDKDNLFTMSLNGYILINNQYIFINRIIKKSRLNGKHIIFPFGDMSYVFIINATVTLRINQQKNNKTRTDKYKYYFEFIPVRRGLKLRVKRGDDQPYVKINKQQAVMCQYLGTKINTKHKIFNFFRRKNWNIKK